MCDTCHSSNIGGVAMSTPTKVTGQGTSAWRVKSIFFFSTVNIVNRDLHQADKILLRI